MGTKLPNDGKDGVGSYACLYLTNQSNKRLWNWGKKAGIYKYMFLDEPNPFHITTMYSKLPVEYVACGSLPPLPVKPLHFSVFGKDNNYLVLEVNSNFAKNLNEKSLMLGAISDYPSYSPHVSLAKDSGVKPTELDKLPPIDFNLYLDREEVSRINSD